MSDQINLLAEQVKGILGFDNQFTWNSEAVIDLLGETAECSAGVLNDAFLQEKTASIRRSGQDVILCFQTLGPEHVDSYTLLDFIQKLVRRGVELSLLPENERGIELKIKYVRCDDGCFEIFPIHAAISRRLRHPDYLSDFDVLSLLCPDNLPPEDKPRVQAIVPEMVSKLFPPEGWQGDWGDGMDAQKASIINNSLLFLALHDKVDFTGAFPNIDPILPDAGCEISNNGIRIATKRVAAVASLFGFQLLEPTDQQMSNRDSCHQLIAGSRSDPFVPITYLFKSDHSYGQLVAARTSSWSFLGAETIAREFKRKSEFVTKVLHAVIESRDNFWESNPDILKLVRARLSDVTSLPTNLGTAKTLLTSYVESSHELYEEATAEHQPEPKAQPATSPDLKKLSNLLKDLEKTIDGVEVQAAGISQKTDEQAQALNTFLAELKRELTDQFKEFQNSIPTHTNLENDNQIIDRMDQVLDEIEKKNHPASATGTSRTG